MRLLITTDTVGGVWTYTKELSEGLLSLGHDVFLVSMGRKPSLDQQAWANLTRLAWPRNFVYLATGHPLEWMQNNLNCYREAESLLLTQIKLWRPDVLHLNQFCYGALPTDVPKVVIGHSDVLSWSQACRGELPCDSAWFRHYKDVVSQGLAQAHAVAAPTHWMLAQLSSYYALPPLQEVIANGRLVVLPRERHARKIQAVTIGRVWDEGKNIAVLDEVLSPMPLLVGGDLSLDTEASFSSSRLQLLGQLSEPAALKLFAESSIYIATSCYEPFGLAPVEAALCGCAIVAHDIPSLREVWGNSALYFKSTSALTRVLNSLCANRPLLTRTAARARARARLHFSRPAMIARYLALYSRLGAPLDAVAETEAPAQHVS